MFETGTLLYNTMVSSGTITLSESIENYKYLRVECCALASGNSLPKNITYAYIPVERIEYDTNTDRCYANSCLQTTSTYYCVDYNFTDTTHIKILNARVAGWSQARFWRVYGLGKQWLIALFQLPFQQTDLQHCPVIQSTQYELVRYAHYWVAFRQQTVGTVTIDTKLLHQFRLLQKEGTY